MCLCELKVCKYHDIVAVDDKNMVALSTFSHWSLYQICRVLCTWSWKSVHGKLCKEYFCAEIN